MRADAIIATGRSDYPNQVNNVLGFPFIFRGALDVRATEINEEMKMAATRALALLAKQDVPDTVAALYGLRNVQFGPDYLIPFPFDPRVLLWVAPAVAWAAVASGVAREFIDLEGYRERLEARLGRARGIMRGLINRAMRDPKRIVFPEGEEPKIIRAASILVDDGIAQPILLGNREQHRAHRRASIGISLDGHRHRGPRHVGAPRGRTRTTCGSCRQRKGLSLDEARRQLFNGNYFGSCMVARGDADALALRRHDALPRDDPARAPGDRRASRARRLVSGMYMLVTERHVVFCADTTVNIDPTAEQLAQIAYRGEPHRAHVGHRAAHRHALLLELRVGEAPRRGEDGARGAAAEGARSVARRRRRDAGRHRARRGDPQARLSVQHAEGAARTC